MKFEKCSHYSDKLIKEKIMGPNPIKLEEELLKDSALRENDFVLDLGSGQGLTSVFLAKEYGYRVIAADLWSDPTENKRFFDEMGLPPERLMPVHADANELPFAHDTFDGIVCTDSYNYFGRDESYLPEKLLPFVKKGGYIYIALTGMKKDCHDNLPEALRLSWTPEQLDYIHDIPYWRNIFEKAEDAEIISLCEMECNEDVWADWLGCDNEYARSDRRAIEAGGCKYMNFISAVLRRKQ